MMPLLWLVLACHVESRCAQEEIEVADDDPLGDLDFTVGDLVADLGGVRTFPALNREGGRISAELALIRADAPAIFSDASWVSGRVRPGLGLSQDMIFIECEDVVTVPFEVDLASSDGSVAVAGQADGITQMWGNTTEGVGGVAFGADFDEQGTLAPGASAGWFSARFDGPDLYDVYVSREDDGVLAFPPGE